MAHRKSSGAATDSNYLGAVSALPSYLRSFAAKSRYDANHGIGLSPADLQAMNAQNVINTQNYEKYESIPAQVKQMEDAGLNPALMYGGSNGAMAAPEVSAESGSAAGVGVTDPGSLMQSVFGSLFTGVQGMYNVLGMKEQLEGLKLKNDETRADVWRKEYENSRLPEVIESSLSVQRAQVDNYKASTDERRKNIEVASENIKKIIAETSVETEKASLIRLQQFGQQYDNIVSEIHSRYAEQMEQAQLNLISSNEKLNQAKSFEAYKSAALAEAEKGKIIYETNHLLPETLKEIKASVKQIQAATKLTEKEAFYYATSKYMEYYESYMRGEDIKRGSIAGNKMRMNQNVPKSFESYVQEYLNPMLM